MAKPGVPNRSRFNGLRDDEPTEIVPYWRPRDYEAMDRAFGQAMRAVGRNRLPPAPPTNFDCVPRRYQTMSLMRTVSALADCVQDETQEKAVEDF